MTVTVSNLFFAFVFTCYSSPIDCDYVANLARGLNMNEANPEVMNQISTDCCSNTIYATGISCISGRVNAISWDSYNLNGSLNATAIPPILIHLDLSNNRIKGQLTGNLPHLLSQLVISENLFNGSISANFPQSLVTFLAGNNHFSGAMPVLPDNMQNLALQDNFLIGEIVALPSSLLSIFLQNNLFSGNIPELPNEIKHVYLGFSGAPGNLFTGTLSINYPISLFINDNLISNLEIQNASRLLYCDISNNPLLENTNLAYLAMCIQDGLYNFQVTTSRRGLSTSTSSSLGQNMLTSTYISSTSSNTSAINAYSSGDSSTLQLIRQTNTFVTVSSTPAILISSWHSRFNIPNVSPKTTTSLANTKTVSVYLGYTATSSESKTTSTVILVVQAVSPNPVAYLPIFSIGYLAKIAIKIGIITVAIITLIASTRACLRRIELTQSQDALNIGR